MVTLYETTADRKPRDVAEANLMDWQKRSTLFESMTAFRPRSFGLTLNDSGAPSVIQTGMVTAGFFPTAGTAPALGRVFTRAEEAAGAQLLVLTDRLWRTRFGGDPAVIGLRSGQRGGSRLPGLRSLRRGIAGPGVTSRAGNTTLAFALDPNRFGAPPSHRNHSGHHPQASDMISQQEFR